MRHRGRYLTHNPRKNVIIRVGLGRIRSWLVGVDRIEQATLHRQLLIFRAKGDLR